MERFSGASPSSPPQLFPLERKCWGGGENVQIKQLKRTLTLAPDPHKPMSVTVRICPQKQNQASEVAPIPIPPYVSPTNRSESPIGENWTLLDAIGHLFADVHTRQLILHYTEHPARGPKRDGMGPIFGGVRKKQKISLLSVCPGFNPTVERCLPCRRWRLALTPLVVSLSNHLSPKWNGFPGRHPAAPHNSLPLERKCWGGGENVQIKQRKRTLTLAPDPHKPLSVTVRICPQ